MLEFSGVLEFACELIEDTDSLAGNAGAMFEAAENLCQQATIDLDIMAKFVQGLKIGDNLHFKDELHPSKDFKAEIFFLKIIRASNANKGHVPYTKLLLFSGYS